MNKGTWLPPSWSHQLSPVHWWLLQLLLLQAWSLASACLGSSAVSISPARSHEMQNYNNTFKVSDMICSDIALSEIIGRQCRSILHTTRTFILPHHANNDFCENLYFSISNVLHLLIRWRGTEHFHNQSLLANLPACHAFSIRLTSYCSPKPGHCK